MNSAIELLNYFINKTKEISQSLSPLAAFEYDHSISATEDCHTIGVHKIDELEEVCGFFTATAILKSEHITFKAEYGDIDYGLHASTEVNEKRYSFNSYLQSVLGKTIEYPINIRTKEQIGYHSDNFLSLIESSYPVFVKNKKFYIRSMTKLTKAEQKKEREVLRRSSAASAIRRANIYFIEEEYDKAYKIYRKYKAFITQPDKLKMDHCKKFKKLSA